jgi:hypothetical protein
MQPTPGCCSPSWSETPLPAVLAAAEQGARDEGYRLVYGCSQGLTAKEGDRPERHPSRFSTLQLSGLREQAEYTDSGDT